MTDTIEYRNFTIKIENDSDSSNPLTDWEVDALVAVYHDGGITLYEGGTAQHRVADNAIEAPIFSRLQIGEDWKEITDALKIFTNRLKHTVQEYTEYEFSEYENFEEMFNEMVSNVLAEMRDQERLEALGELYNMHPDYAAFTGTGRGYSQSCWHDILVVTELKHYRTGDTNTPEAIEAAEKGAESVATLYRDWAYGDVHGYIVEDQDGDDVDSCWGFYGEYGTDNYKYIIDQAKEVVDATIAARGEQLEMEFVEEVA